MQHFVGSVRQTTVPLCCLILAFGLRASGQSAESDNARFRLAGTVINSVTGAPIRRAVVEITSSSPRLALTDSNGQFEFDNLIAGQTTIVARKPGFFSEQQVSDSQTGLALTKISQDTPAVTLKLVPQSVIYGRVQSTDGEPIEGIPVKAVTARIVDGSKQWQDVSAASSDEDGNFRVANLTPGTYYLEIGPTGGFDNDSGVGIAVKGFPAMFYPGVADVASATPLELGPGEELNVEPSLRPIPVFKVSGTITGSTGRGVNISFSDHLGNNFSFLRRFNPETGQFEAEIPGGSYTMQATAWSADGPRETAEIPLNVSSSVSGLVIALGSEHPIPVIFNAHDMKGQLSAARPESLLSIHLTRTGDQFGNSQFWSALQPGPASSLAIPEPAPGTYFVALVTGGPWYVESAECGGADLLREPLTISAGSQTPPIEIAIRNDGANLSGELVSADGSGPATVLLIPEGETTAQIKAENIGAGARFLFQNLAPGPYSVLAIAGRKALEYKNPAVLEQYLSAASHINLQPNGRQRIELQPVNGAH